MSYQSVKFREDLISGYRVVLLTDKQTDTGEDITFLAEVKINPAGASQ